MTLPLAVERDVEIARTGEDPLEADEHVRPSQRAAENARFNHLPAQVSRAQPKFKIVFSTLPANASLSAVVNGFAYIYLLHIAKKNAIRVYIIYKFSLQSGMIIERSV